MIRLTVYTITIILVLVGVQSTTAQGFVSLDHIDGVDPSGNIQIGSSVTFHLQLSNTGYFSLAGSTNGFRVYSPNGAIWTPLMPDTTNVDWGNMYDGGLFFTFRSVTGVGADTIGFGGFAIEMPGIPPGFDQVVFLIQTSVEEGQAGKTLCLDSCYYPPAGEWFWSHSIHGNTEPAWDGPHCLSIGCCTGARGNINGDSDESIDISDLIYLVEYMFSNGPEPPCFEEANIDGDNQSSVDIADLIYLVDFMFSDGPSPVDCL